KQRKSRERDQERLQGTPTRTGRPDARFLLSLRPSASSACSAFEAAPLTPGRRVSACVLVAGRERLAGEIADPVEVGLPQRRRIVTAEVVADPRERQIRPEAVV